MGKRLCLHPVFWGVLATLTLFLFALWIGSQVDCSSEGVCQTKFSIFLAARPNEVGDTLAGFAGALAFVWIIVTVWLQSQELSEQRRVLSEQKDEFAKTNENMLAQRFEVSFFELLATLNSIVESIDIINANGQVTAKGRDCIKIYYERLVKLYEKRSSQSNLERINEEFWTKYSHEFGHYFRFLYNSLRAVSENPQSQERHGKLLRAMLSDHELLLLFYNCLHPKGEKMIKYVVEFELFDNLPVEKLLDPKHEKLVPATAFGREDTSEREAI
ncbi:putative phage abortive infection protein [Ruegeria aquimaris]|uniref:Phage abortive infection protein n=1 Tax=Ruegeria aquimaris TaxID=2984333 RepID=A0ABT3AF62_9RHOB|nr:putative phage abortive infection protein [Ruegeria sp. XHP0148]MCV2887314.1 putative phage abortive infection protein [Ruegeria sp. XHP0148]